MCRTAGSTCWCQKLSLSPGVRSGSRFHHPIHVDMGLYTVSTLRKRTKAVISTSCKKQESRRNLKFINGNGGSVANRPGAALIG